MEFCPIVTPITANDVYHESKLEGNRATIFDNRIKKGFARPIDRRDGQSAVPSRLKCPKVFREQTPKGSITPGEETTR